MLKILRNDQSVVHNWVQHPPFPLRGIVFGNLRSSAVEKKPTALPRWVFYVFEISTGLRQL